MASRRQRPAIIINVELLRSRKVIAGLGITLVATCFLLITVAVRAQTRPARVWSGMLDTTLATKSVTKRSLSSQESDSIEQLTQISFVGQPTIHSVVELRQKNQDKTSSEVKTETITTANNDYSRYVSIKTGAKNSEGKPVSYGSVEGLWGKGSSDELAGMTPLQNLQRAIVALVPIAFLPDNQRKTVIDEINTKRIYDVDVNKAKSEKVSGRAVWTYTVKVKLVDYIPVLKRLFQAAGLRDLMYLDEKNYSTAPAEEFKLSVDKFSHQIVQLQYNDGSSEQYSSYGLQMAVQEPTKTVPLAEIQQKLQATQQ